MAVAEMLGTGMFTFMGCSNIVSNITGADTNHINTVISFVFGLCGAIIIFGQISGALLNPALNVAAVLLGQMSLQKCLFYTIFQVIGGTLGVYAVKMVSPAVGQNFCMTLPSPDVSIGAVFTVEFITTGILTLAFCSVLDPRAKDYMYLVWAKFLVIITGIAMSTAKYGGCSMNPARSFGPALLASNWEHHWLYWTATIGSAMVFSILYQAFFYHELFEEEKKEDSNPI